MPQLLQLFILVPLFAFLISMFMPKKNERLISSTAIGFATIHLLGLISFIVYWLMNGHAMLNIKHFVLYKNSEFEFFIDLYFDKTSAVFALIGDVIILLVGIFSKTYLHRESGFKRFFNTFLLFFLGYNLIIFSGNFETLFIGWEILGLCSFLLIAFYRDRYLPVKNGIKVISVYRLGDVCLMLAMWMCHHLFHENITFLKLNDTAFIAEHLAHHAPMVMFTAIMIVVAAAAKSAMLPFSSWLPRAMEGPTTSSAVFYGSLSVHIGAFLLLRTYALWENIPAIKILIIALGIATGLIASSIARVQSTVKTQIAYSSITQIGLIFIEVALGFHILALVHFAGNAFLRTYQLLVSPSVLGYQIHDMFFNFTASTQKQNSSKLKNSFYVLGIKEWNLDWLMYKFLWMPFKWLGNKIHFLGGTTGLIFLVLTFIAGLFTFSIEREIPVIIDESLTIIFALLGLLLVLKAFTERGNSIAAWIFVIAGQCFITLSIAMNDYMEMHQVVIYLSGIFVSAIVGYICLLKIKQIDNDIELNRFHGYSYEKPVTSFVFLLCCLGLLGFPFTPTFLGIDLLFTHIHKHQIALITITALSFLFIEIAILRLYARVFMGQHKKNNHPIAYRSS